MFARGLRVSTPSSRGESAAGPVGERSHTVHAYCVNTPPWQVFTHLPVNPKKSLSFVEHVWRTLSVPTVVWSTISASYSSVEDLCAYSNTSEMLRRMWFFKGKACRPYHTLCGWTDNNQAEAGRCVDASPSPDLHLHHRHQFICKPSQVGIKAFI
jgi:hypothetical protein